MTDLRDSVYQAARQAMADAGGDPAAVDRAAIVRKYVALGAKRTSVFRWIALALMPPAAPRPDVKNLPEIPVVIMPPMPLFKPGMGESPPGPSAFMGGSVVYVLEKLMLCIQAACDVMANSRHADGKVRIAKTLVGASEHLRRTLETAVKLHESLVSLQKMERFMDAILGELEAETPETAKRVIARLRALDAKWRSQGEG